MSEIPRVHWGDEGVSSFNFWWNLIDADALNIYLLASIVSSSDAKTIKRHCALARV